MLLSLTIFFVQCLSATINTSSEDATILALAPECIAKTPPKILLFVANYILNRLLNWLLNWFYAVARPHLATAGISNDWLQAMDTNPLLEDTIGFKNCHWFESLKLLNEAFDLFQSLPDDLQFLCRVFGGLYRQWINRQLIEDIFIGFKNRHWFESLQLLNEAFLFQILPHNLQIPCRVVFAVGCLYRQWVNLYRQQQLLVEWFSFFLDPSSADDLNPSITSFLTEARDIFLRGEVDVIYIEGLMTSFDNLVDHQNLLSIPLVVPVPHFNFNLDTCSDFQQAVSLRLEYYEHKVPQPVHTKVKKLCDAVFHQSLDNPSFFKSFLVMIEIYFQQH